MKISEFQQWTKDTDRATKWDLLTTIQIMSHLTEEMGELAQSINRINDYKGEIQEKHSANLKRELVDVFWFLVKIANRYDVSLEDGVEDLVKRANSWPIDQYRSQLKEGLISLDKELTKAKEELDLND